MEGIEGRYTHEEIDQAGRILVAAAPVGKPEDEWLEAVHLVNSWRATHSGPLNTFQANLRRRVGGDGIVARRLKRLPSIVSKLARLPRIPLSQMQDIGGCRAVVATTDNAFDLAADLAASRIRHRLVRYKNYVDFPRPSGYRSLHLVYAYNSEQTTRWQGLNVEIQLRSELQHRWATAVETVGTFIGDDLKSNVGDQTWLRFFKLMSAAIAQREGTPEIPNAPTDRRELVKEIEECDRILGGTSERLAMFQALTRRLQALRGISNHWVVLELNLETGRVSGRAFRPNDLDQATAYYLERELGSRESQRVDVVLVSASSLNALRRAYPNYFADLAEFRHLIRETLGNRWRTPL